MINGPSKYELYCAYVTTITAAEQRRQQASAVYLSLISAGIALLGVVKTLDPLYIIFPICIVSSIWLMTLVYFRRLSKSKFFVISILEEGWDYKPFSIEWENFKKQKRNPLLRIGLAHLEMAVPISIIILSILYTLHYLYISIHWEYLLIPQ